MILCQKEHRVHLTFTMSSELEAKQHNGERIKCDAALLLLYRTMRTLCTKYKRPFILVLDSGQSHIRTGITSIISRCCSLLIELFLSVHPPT